MTPHTPVEDPSDHGSLMDRSVIYVRSHAILRIALITTAIDHIAAIALVLSRRISVEWGGVLVLFSSLAWFFAVCLPLMNRSVRIRLGVQGGGHWNELSEMLFRFFLFLVTVLYTATLVWAFLQSTVWGSPV